MGREVLFVLTNGREIAPAARAGMLHDASGDDWPKCSLLISRFDGWRDEPTSRERSDARDYFGRGAEIGVGVVDFPPMKIALWTPLGEVSEVFYDRAGTKAPGYFRHRFHKPRGLWKLIFLFKRAAKKPVVLYRLGRAYRLELPDGCIVDDRGLALP